MRKKTLSFAAVLLAAVASPAAVIQFQLDGVLNSVSNGTPVNAQIAPSATWTLDVSFDDAGLTGEGVESTTATSTQGNLLGYSITSRTIQFVDGAFSLLNLDLDFVGLDTPGNYVLRAAGPDLWTIEKRDFNGRGSVFHDVTSSYQQGGGPPTGRLFGEDPTETPEPSTLFLFGAGLVGLVQLHRRR